MAQSIFDEHDEIRNENAEREGDILRLIDYIAGLLPQQYHVPGRGDPETRDEYRATLTNAQRGILIEALRHLR